MAGRVVTERICEHLKQLKRKTEFKLEYVEAWTEARGHKVSRQTVSRALNGKVKHLRNDSAEMLATFVEAMTDGAVVATTLLEEKYIVDQKFEEENLLDKNFTFYRFEKVIFKNVTLVNVRFEHALLNNVTFENVKIEKTIFTQSRWENVVVLGCRVTGSTFSDVHMQKANWSDTKLMDCVFKRE